MKYINDEYLMMMLSIVTLSLSMTALILCIIDYSNSQKQPDYACVEVRMTLNKKEVHVMCGKLTKGIE